MSMACGRTRSRHLSVMTNSLVLPRQITGVRACNPSIRTVQRNDHVILYSFNNITMYGSTNGVGIYSDFYLRK